MRARPFYLVTCGLAVAAILISGASKTFAGRAASAEAHSAESISSDDREALHSAAHLYAGQSDRLSHAAAVFFVSAIGVWIFSLWRRERGFQGIPLLLLLLAGLLQFVVV